MTDVLGLALEDAEALLKREGASYRVQETAPRRREPLEGSFRVVGQRQDGSACTLIVCRVPDGVLKDDLRSQSPEGDFPDEPDE